jgi:hypothetical protein
METTQEFDEDLDAFVGQGILLSGSFLNTLIEDYEQTQEGMWIL